MYGTLAATFSNLKFEQLFTWTYILELNKVDWMCRCG